MTKKIKKISSSEDTADPGLNASIEGASKGLVYISETDAEIIPFTGKKVDVVTAGEAAEQAGISPGEPVQEISISDFFDKLTEPREWWGDQEKERASGFAALRDVLTSTLTELKVYRFGRIRIDILIVGKDSEGRLAGIRTRAVET